MHRAVVIILLVSWAVALHAAAGDLPPDCALDIRSYFGATGDGITDDSLAFERACTKDKSGNLWVDRQTAVDYYFGRPRTVFLPAGTYRVKRGFTWVGCAVSFVGEGPDRSVIRLDDDCRGFDDPADPQSVLRAPAGNHSFRQNVRGLTIDIGAGNPGAIALDFNSSNSGTVRDVRLTAASGSGWCGLALTQAWPGPLLVKDLQVDGFAYGVRVAQAEYGPTFEDLTLIGQRERAFVNDGNICAIRHLVTDGTVPAIENLAGHGMLILLESTLTAPPGATTAAITGTGRAYLRDVAVDGFADVLHLDGAAAVPGPRVDEHVAGPIRELFSSPDSSLCLPVLETPTFTSGDPADWMRFTTRWYGDTDLQPFLDGPEPILFFSTGGYLFHVEDDRTWTVPAHKRLVCGFGAVMNSNGTHGLRLVVADDGPEPLIIEQFGYGVHLIHRGARPVVLAHGGYRYTSELGAGPLYLQDVQLGELTLQPGQRVWARQLNTEGDQLHLDNPGGTLWILGVKTELKGTVIRTRDGGCSELLGTLIYPLNSPRTGLPAFENLKSSQSLVFGYSHYGTATQDYEILVREVRGGETRQIHRDDADWPGRFMDLFTGYGAGWLRRTVRLRANGAPGGAWASYPTTTWRETVGDTAAFERLDPGMDYAFVVGGDVVPQQVPQ